MKSLIRKCNRCSRYTLGAVCATCGGSTEMAMPPRYSTADRFQKYRLREKKMS